MKRTAVITLAVLGMLIFAKEQASAGDVSFSGFVDSSYVTDNNADTQTFSFDQVELDIEGTTPDGKAKVRVDLNWFNRADDPLTATNESNLNFDDVVEQGYVEIPVGDSLAFTIGKFNAPIGWELLDAPDMFQFSHALVFDYGLPTNLTGAMLTFEEGMFDVALYYVNGWDLITDDNNEKTVGGRLGITPTEGVNIGISHISGKEGAAAATPRLLTVTDIDFSFGLVENLTVGAEYNQGKYKGMSAVVAGQDADWSGYMVMGHYDFNDWFGLTVRYDEFKDEDGQRFGNGVNERWRSYTVAPTFVIAEGLGALLEYRSTKSSLQTFTDKGGNPTSTYEVIALELTYSF